MKRILIFLLLLFSMKGLGQGPQLDSLKMVVKKLSVQPISVQRDSIMTISIAKITGFTLNDLDLTQFWTDSLNRFSKTSRWEQSLAYSHNANSVYYFYRGLSNLAFKEMELSVGLFKKLHNEKMYALTFSNLVAFITHFILVKPIADEATEKKYLNYLLDGLALAKKAENREIIANMNLCLMQYFVRHKNYEESKKYAINSWEVTKNEPEKYFYYYHCGKASEGLNLLYLGKQKEGFGLLNQAKDICRKQRKDEDGSQKLLLGAIGVYLGDYYIEKKDYKNAVIEAKMAVNALEKINQPNYNYLLNKIFYKAYKNLGKPVEALIYFEKVQAYDQDAQTKESIDQYTQWQLKYDDEKQKNQIQVLENQKLTQIRNFLSLISLFALCVIGYVFWNNQKLKKKNQEIEQALFKGQTIERKRVAQELHDNLSAKISGIRWRLEAIEPDFKVEKHKKIYESSVNALAEIYTDVRLIAHNLLPAELETKGLSVALQSLTKELNGLNKTEFSLNINENIGRFQNKIEYELFSIVLELSNNILKHSQAKNALISLEIEKNLLKLLVSDNGIGIDEDSIKRGMGMSNLKSRVASLNGKMTIENREGVCAVIEVPV
jgi:signal transduction histidine kinase